MTVDEGVGSPTQPALSSVPLSPRKPLTPWRLLRAARADWLGACDDALFKEMIVERRVMLRRCFIVNDPDGIRRIVQDYADNYPRYYPIRQLFKFGAASGMLYAEGDEWRRHRRLINPTLDHRALVADVPVLVDLARRLADHLARLPPGQPIDIAQTLLIWVVASASHVFAGDDREIEGMVDRLGNYPKETSLLNFVPFPDWLPFFRRYRAGPTEARHYASLLDRLINKRRAADYVGRRDLLWRMAHAAEREHDGQPRGLSTVELRDEILTLAATSRSTLRPLTWVWYLLARHQWAEKKLHAELDRVLDGGQRSPAAADLPRLVFLRRLIDETMRLYPPLPVFIPRVARIDDMICGHRVPAGSIVLIIPWVLHRHRLLWRDPDRFDPARFSPEQVAERSRYAYLPFSIGPHVCVGASFAMLQIAVAIAVLAQRFRFRLTDADAPIEPKGWIHLSPSRPVMMTVEPR